MIRNEINAENSLLEDVKGMETALAHQMNANPFVCFKRSHLSGNSGFILQLIAKKYFFQPPSKSFTISKINKKFKVAHLVF